VFCHTPHGGQVGTDKPPLWNKALPASGTYTVYSSTTMDGASDLTGSVSLACLSCHDGSQAMDNMINAPGSGGYSAGGANQNWSWSVSSTMPGGAVTNLGKDLTNDHPVAIPFCGGGVTGAGNAAVTAATGTCADADFNGPGFSTGGSNKVYSKTVGSNEVFWVDTNDASKRDKTDLMLYGTTNATGPTVECASCHDPHSSTNATFLRISNANSAVCLACHNK
jgi:predicted CXXCH cytochrome family protein